MRAAEGPMAVADRLRELASIEGFSGAALFTAAGELLGSAGADGQLEAVGRAAGDVLLVAERALIAMGAGRGRQVHVAGEKAHVLVRRVEGEPAPPGPGRGGGPLHLVMVLAPGADVARAGARLAASLREPGGEPPG